MESCYFPEAYTDKLSILDTEIAIKLVKDTFEKKLAENLTLTRVSAPLFVRPESGLNDDLNGVERPVGFDVPDAGCEVEIVHSLAKWKRQALKRYHFAPNTGLYTDMNAIRRDEELDNLHSVYVDQWDWEKIITPETRTVETLKQTVRQIVKAVKGTQNRLAETFPQIKSFLSTDITFLTTQELEDRYPDLTPREREDAVCREHKTVFLMQIGGLLKSGQKHDGRAPDYDDWALNGDLLIWYPLLNRAVELSSMGIRVDAAALQRQLAQAGCEQRKTLPFHQQLLSGELPLTMGGGIGQSRLCMVLLQKAHIGEVQASIWQDDMIKACEEKGITLL
ncbi:aspartate--ammonia ligase [Massiliimalia massiliensis]|uniref:aspartate--ammonia ligase n=1 Tax=Massiliimalia massiliensis TaxID=1852384 RepID=UPI001179E251|nr:aspartate--ammonia ligase [Massiliimalia massiliensis]